ncbi:hypothetical protein [Virgibacillus sp. YIM 98842]|uniref:hypothetical protein n=1 Tax=Virgibacillus sp. YIM 98842 TaxID=2663533 RepID=UPI0013DB9279|nr:hypothetical protein [Virgibacillus sp. YIM 98842]
MNFIATLLYTIGWVCIASGIILGYFNHLPNVPGMEEASFVTFVTHVFVGVVSGILMFGFAEIVKLLDEQKRIQKEVLREISNMKQGLIEEVRKINNLYRS